MSHNSHLQLQINYVSPSLIVRHGMSANDAISNSTNENLSARGLSFYDGDVLVLTSAIGRMRVMLS